MTPWNPKLAILYGTEKNRGRYSIMLQRMAAISTKLGRYQRQQIVALQQHIQWLEARIASGDSETATTTGILNVLI